MPQYPIPTISPNTQRSVYCSVRLVTGSTGLAVDIVQIPQSFYLQSSSASFLVCFKFVNKRRATANTLIIIRLNPTPRMAYSRDGPLVKFGGSPLGFTAKGGTFDKSVPGGREPMAKWVQKVPKVKLKAEGEVQRLFRLDLEDNRMH